ncbi:Hypothetical predicted protein [Mytilus galloprovincialis]|uniref:Uncharacterized protein n=1 Tax=Mytilus galloprovincialis TaxID=29158 RepID=A0A8B6C1I5_MYTGA|nr:Hypothetical predicted protein [Mytilus galloprovincialis]
MNTSISPIQTLGVDRFERLSTWSRLVRAISLLKRKIVSSNRSKVDTKDTKTCVDIRKEAKTLVLRENQSQYYSNEIDCLKSGKQLPKNRNIIALSPILDSEGLLRLGGRLKHSKLETGEKMPLIIPGVDTFGPWSVVTRRQHGGAANSKTMGNNVFMPCYSCRPH